MLVSKHVLSEARPELITALDCHTYSPTSHGRKKNHNNHNVGDVHPKLLSFVLSGKVQTASTRLHAPVNMSDKHLQLLKHGGRSRACLSISALSFRDFDPFRDYLGPFTKV